jgi:prefoldin subunit 5
MEMSVVKKSISAWLDLAKKKKKKSPKSFQKIVKKLSKNCQKVQKIVKKLSNILSDLVKINQKEMTNFLENLL